MKKIIAWILLVTFLFGSMPVPSLAATPFKGLDIEEIFKEDDTTTAEPKSIVNHQYVGLGDEEEDDTLDLSLPEGTVRINALSVLVKSILEENNSWDRLRDYPFEGTGFLLPSKTGLPSPEKPVSEPLPIEEDVEEVSEEPVSEPVNDVHEDIIPDPDDDMVDDINEETVSDPVESDSSESTEKAVPAEESRATPDTSDTALNDEDIVTEESNPESADYKGEETEHNQAAETAPEGAPAGDESAGDDSSDPDMDKPNEEILEGKPDISLDPALYPESEAIMQQVSEEQSWFNSLVGPSIANNVRNNKYTVWDDTSEIVSPQTGELTLRFDDIHLPGRNGLDLRISRIYQSSQARTGK
ncbi:hypothetical protein [Dehalobacterium formicoaceticum]|uniref:hypothetical protein n=1 Tax=Dehalobacterium formicoaceticum TaxID=51515 RepID=UPI000B7F6269|nr:hypothetical protein [Dehalobacterium formicoaceticum]